MLQRGGDGKGSPSSDLPVVLLSTTSGRSGEVAIAAHLPRSDLSYHHLCRPDCAQGLNASVHLNETGLSMSLLK